MDCTQFPFGPKVRLYAVFERLYCMSVSLFHREHASVLHVQLSQALIVIGEWEQVNLVVTTAQFFYIYIYICDRHCTYRNVLRDF